MTATPSSSRDAGKNRPAEAAPLVLVHGDDDFRVKERAKEIHRGWVSELGGDDHEVIDGFAANTSEALQSLGRLREALMTLPFFGGGKAIWWQNCNFLGDDRTSTSQAVVEGVNELGQTLKSFSWDSVRLLISAGKVDRRKAFYKTLAKLGSAEMLNAWSIDDRHWQGEAETLARRLLRERQVRIAESDLAELVVAVGPNRQQLESEVEKIALYVGEKGEVDGASLRLIVSRNKQARAFALGDALGERQLADLLQRLDEELWEMKFDRQKSEIGLLYGLISKVRMMLFMKELEREKRIRPTQNYGSFKDQLAAIPAETFPEDRRFNPLAMNPYPLFRAMHHARNYSTEELVVAMERLLSCNEQLIFSNLEGGFIMQQALTQIVRGN